MEADVMAMWVTGSIRALRIRIGFWGICHYSCTTRLKGKTQNIGARIKNPNKDQGFLNQVARLCDLVTKVRNKVRNHTYVCL